VNRPLTLKEIQLTQQDLAFKQAVLTDVEAKVRDILPALVTACIAEIWEPFIDEVIETVNRLELQLEMLDQKDSK
jgi:hypothetical protein